MENSPNLSHILKTYIFHWRYFLLSLFLTISITFVFLYFTNPTYEIKSSILISDKSKAPESKPMLQELDPLSFSKNVENELAIINSRKLMSKVVDELQLFADYQIINGLSDSSLYNNNPIEFRLIDKGTQLENTTLYIILINQDSVYVTINDDNQKKIIFNDPITSKIGTWVLIKNSNINQYIGSTIRLEITDKDKIVDKYWKSFDAYLESKVGAIVNLTISDKVPQRGIDILNTLIKFYNDDAINENNSITQKTLDFIDDRLYSLSGELFKAEREVEGFRSNLGLTDISSEAKVFLENVQTNDAKLNEVNVQLSVIENIESIISSNPNSASIPPTIGIIDPALNSLILKLSELQIEKDQLLSSTPEGNPIFAPINSQISSIKLSIVENLKNIKSSLISTKTELESFNKNFEKSIKNIPGYEREFLGIKRDQAIKEDLYIYLLEKREELSLSYASTLTDVRIIESPYKGPIKFPKKSIFYAFAVLFGFILPVGLIKIRELFSNYIIDPNEIEEKVEVPVIAELSFSHSKNYLPVIGNSHSELGEQFKFLITKINRLHGGKQNGRVTLITSSISGEGKSFVSANLSASLAELGKKTIILDLDLRYPKISDIFNLPPKHQGVIDFVNGNFNIEELIQPSGKLNGLDILSSGSKTSSPLLILERPEMQVLLKHLRTKYDDIIIDTPPVHLVTDALLISRLSDVSLYVFRQGYSEKSLFPFVKKLHKEQNFPQLNIVFNGIINGRYGYGNSYGTGYYHRK